MSPAGRLTKHAQVRLQQRGIPALMLPIILAYGSESYQKGGTSAWCLPSSVLKKLRRELKEILSRLDSLENAYFVENEAGTVITVGHQFN